jgi:hypothetical protein
MSQSWGLIAVFISILMVVDALCDGSFLRVRPWEVNQDASKAVSSEYIGI